MTPKRNEEIAGTSTRERDSAMRTVTYGAACSLDGFIARKDDAVDWLHFSRDVHAVMTEYWKRIDTILMGRKTWDLAAAQGGGDFARSLFAAGLIDEVGINVHPVLLGSGIPLFVDPGRQVDLKLAECRVIEGDCVLATYQVCKKTSTKRSQGG